jgi:small subunit ribosomal protein S16
MATVIRLQRGGRKNLDFYRIMVADSAQKRDGRFLEEIGQYDPNPTPAQIVLKEERALEWLGVGAVPSNTVKSILRRQGVLAKFEAVKNGQDAAAVQVAPRAEKAKKPTISRKAKAKAEAAAA